MAAAYQLLAEGGGVLRLADGAAIPPDPRNADWRDYQAWCAAGGVPDPAPEPPPRPRYVPVPTIRERMEAHGTWEVMAAILAQQPAAMLKVLSLREGVAADDPEARAMIAAAGDDPDLVLAP